MPGSTLGPALTPGSTPAPAPGTPLTLGSTLGPAPGPAPAPGPGTSLTLGSTPVPALTPALGRRSHWSAKADGVGMPGADCGRPGSQIRATQSSAGSAPAPWSHTESPGQGHPRSPPGQASRQPGGQLAGAHHPPDQPGHRCRHEAEATELDPPCLCGPGPPSPLPSGKGDPGQGSSTGQRSSPGRGQGPPREGEAMGSRAWSSGRSSRTHPERMGCAGTPWSGRSSPAPLPTQPQPLAPGRCGALLGGVCRAGPFGARRARGLMPFIRSWERARRCFVSP